MQTISIVVNYSGSLWRTGGEIVIFVDELKERFSYGLNEDFVLREIYIKSLDVNGVIIYLNGMVNKDTLEKLVLCPLMEIDRRENCPLSLERIIETLIPIGNVQKVKEYKGVYEAILSGRTLLFLKGYDEAIVINTIGYEHRAVERGQTETVVKGPSEAFVESGEVNSSLIRKQLRDEKLIKETLTIGESAVSKIYIMYLKNIANDELVEKVKKRLKEIKVDSIQNLELLEQHIEDRPYSILPSILYTERPDRTASFLREGHIVLLMDSSSASLVLPVTFWSFFHSAEDQYQRWAYGNFLRVIRIMAVFIALLTPGFYVAITNYHTESVATDLLLAIAATRETLPMPVIFEVILMEVSFELLREAGIRIPNPMGPTIGILGALILGQAAVQANIISPILIVVVAITGLSSFAIPEPSLNYAVRITRFLFLFLGATFGFIGVAGGFTAFISYVATEKSFDVPFLSPVTPHYRSSKDTILRPPTWKQWLRPFNITSTDRIKGKRPERS
jgi:spore germination protein KA